MSVEFRNIEPPSSSWKLFPRHPASEEHGNLSNAVAKQMREDIAEYGVMIRPVVLKREQGGMMVLDGWQMYQACIATDVKPTFVELVSGIPDDKYTKIVNGNRLHQTPQEKAKEKKKRLVKLKKAVAAGIPVAEAAKELGISRTTAFLDLKPDPKQLPRCDRCERVNATGDDCPRCQLLRMDLGADEEEPPKNGDQAPPPPPVAEEPPRLDTLFVAIPERAIKAFEAADRLAQICHSMDQDAKELAKILSHKHGSRAISPTAAQRLKDVRQHIWQARATHVCAYCQGNQDQCDACNGQGWQPNHQFAQAPQEMQDAMKAMGAKNVPI